MHGERTGGRMDGLNCHTRAARAQRVEGGGGGPRDAGAAATCSGLWLCPCPRPRVHSVIQQLILTERAHGPGPGLGTCHLACPLMASASQGGQAGGLSGSQSSGLWLRRGHSEGMGWVWFAALPSCRPAHPQGLAPLSAPLPIHG